MARPVGVDDVDGVTGTRIGGKALQRFDFSNSKMATRVTRGEAIILVEGLLTIGGDLQAERRKKEA